MLWGQTSTWLNSPKQKGNLSKCSFCPGMSSGLNLNGSSNYKTNGRGLRAWIYPLHWPASMTLHSTELITRLPPRLLERLWWWVGGSVHRAAAGEPPLLACVFSVPLPTGTAFCPTHKDTETLTERGPGRSLPDVIQLPIQCPHGVPFSVHYLAATAAVEFSFCFDTLGLHHLIPGKPL